MTEVNNVNAGCGFWFLFFSTKGRKKQGKLEEAA